MGPFKGGLLQNFEAAKIDGHLCACLAVSRAGLHLICLAQKPVGDLAFALKLSILSVISRAAQDK